MSQIHDLQPWYWRSLPLEDRTGSQIFDCLFRHTGAIATLLESPYPTPKERAEHIMLVDLEPNDLGRVCEWGSVEVKELFTIERYSHVMHLPLKSFC
jgi:hypothetical protein